MQMLMLSFAPMSTTKPHRKLAVSSPTHSVNGPKCIAAAIIYEFDAMDGKKCSFFPHLTIKTHQITKFNIVS